MRTQHLQKRVAALEVRCTSAGNWSTLLDCDPKHRLAKYRSWFENRLRTSPGLLKERLIERPVWLATRNILMSWKLGVAALRREQ